MQATAADVAAAALDAFNRRDVPALLDLIDPTVEWIPLLAVMEGDVYRGHTGVRKYLSDIEEDMADYRLEAEQIRDGDDGAVVVLGTIHGRGVASGMELDMPCAWLLRLEGGRIRHMRAYPSPEQALRAGGLA